MVELMEAQARAIERLEKENKELREAFTAIEEYVSEQVLGDYDYANPQK